MVLMTKMNGLNELNESKDLEDNSDLWKPLDRNIDEDSFDCVSDKTRSDNSYDSEEESVDVDEEESVDVDIMEAYLCVIFDVLCTHGIEFDEIGVCEEANKAWMECNLGLSKKFLKFLREKELISFMSEKMIFSFVNVPKSWDRKKDSIFTIKIDFDDLEEVKNRLEVTKGSD